VARERTDGVAAVVEVVALMRRRLPALTVTYEPGWEKRGNGLAARYVGGIVHHTASASSSSRPFPTRTILRDGRPDLDGPLCNFAGPWCTVERPALVVMAAHPANHAGASGGRSMGPLPRTSLFNPRVLGLEIDYAGTRPMSDGQALVAQVWAWAVAEVVDGTVEHVRGHAETSITGKWDPGYALVKGVGQTINLAAFRARAALTAVMGVDLSAPISDDNVRRIAAAVTPAVVSALLAADASPAEGQQPLAPIVSQLWSGTSPGHNLLNNALAELPDRIAQAVSRGVADAVSTAVAGVKVPAPVVDVAAIARAVGTDLAARMKA